MMSFCPHDLYRYCQSDLEPSDTFSPLAKTESHPHNQSTQPSTQYPCHTARTPAKHLLRRFFLIRRISPVSNGSLSPSTLHSHVSAHMPASSYFSDLGRLERWKAGEVVRGRVGKVAGGWTWWEKKKEIAFFGGLLRACDFGRCYCECDDRGQPHLDHGDSITTRPL